MRLLTKNELRQVTRVVLMAEKYVEFNGCKKRFLEPTNDVNCANCVVFLTRNDFGCEDKIVIGNLSNDAAKNMMKTLLEKDYLDVSEMKFQKEFGKNGFFKFDEGNSLPYMTDTVGMEMTGFDGPRVKRIMPLFPNEYTMLDDTDNADWDYDDDIDGIDE